MDAARSTTVRRVIPDTRLRDALIAVGAGLLVLGFVLFAVLSLGKQAASTGGVKGMIISKEFISQPETQVTVGRGGVSSRQIAGEYILHVRVPSERNKTYRVYVDRNTYESKDTGERYYFVR